MMFALCPNDWTAIRAGRDCIRAGHALEVWRDDSLVYRLGLTQELIERRRAKRKLGGVRRLFQRLFLSKNFFSIMVHFVS